MKRILCLGFLVAGFAMFANVETAEARHRPCYRTGFYSGGYYGSPYGVGYSNYGYASPYGYGSVYGYGYAAPRHGFHRHRNFYRGPGAFRGGHRGGVYIGF